MAKTWTVTEAYEAINTNDVNGIADFGKRFPLATVALARAGKNPGLDVLMSAMPDRVTMRILEMQLKEGVSDVADDDEDEAEEVVEEKPAKTEKKEKAAKATKTEKTEKKAEKKTEEKAEKKAAKKVEKPVEEDEAEDEDEAVDYKSMSAPELFKLCKKRGIKVEPKQKSSVYIKALEAADNGSDEDADDGDDWDI